MSERLKLFGFKKFNKTLDDGGNAGRLKTIFQHVSFLTGADTQNREDRYDCPNGFGVVLTACSEPLLKHMSNQVSSGPGPYGAALYNLE
jgi:hypothetical protein